MTLPADFIHDLSLHFSGDIRTDPGTRWLYSTDASIYQIQPLGVVFPRSLDDLPTVVALAAQYHVPILARGAGSSLAGQAIGDALIIDCSRYLTKIHDINVIRENAVITGGTITAEPGIVLNALNRTVAQYGLQFGPDPASAERATLGGSLANNATGAHSILYGMAADHLLSADVILADGTVTEFAEREVTSKNLGLNTDLESQIYAAAFHIREHYADVIKERWPKVWRRASGYNINYLLPWSPGIPSEWQASYNPQAIYNVDISRSTINLAPLLAGSEGTLAVIRRAKLHLVPIPQYTALGILAYNSLAEACDAVPDLLNRHHPSAVELISQLLIQLARSVPAYASQLSWVKKAYSGNGDPAALLVVEFSGDDINHVIQQTRALGPDVLIADTPDMQKQVWTVRKVGLGILQSRPGEKKPVTFIEDLVVPVGRLGEYVREMERIMVEHETVGDFYAHASAGCLHFRPLLNIKTTHGIAEMREIAKEAIGLVLRLGGTTSGEHGDGIARSEWVEQAYGAEIFKAFRILKAAADPQGLLNPGKIIDAPRMDDNLRAKLSPDLAWIPVMDFTRNGGADGSAGLVGAVDMCNGAGVCRKAESVMCPSFQVTQDEKYSTRGRSNLLRALMSSDNIFDEENEGEVHSCKRHALKEQKVWESFDLCLACKGCKSECPSGVDMAKLKYEFLQHYYDSHRRRLRDYLFGYIGVIAPLGSIFAPIVNSFMRQPIFRRGIERYFGLSCQRPFPRFASRVNLHLLKSTSSEVARSDSQTCILFLRDTFNHYFYPEVETAALRLLQNLNVKVKLLPILGAGRTLISKGFLTAAKKHAARVVEAIQRIDPEHKYPILGIEPSEIYTLSDEFLDFFPGVEDVSAIAERAWMLDEFLIRLDRELPTQPLTKKVLLHGHCYQKARPPAPDGKPTGVGATTALLKAVGYQVEIIDDGCCGMAGAFGYEAEHYATSIEIGELSLFPAIRNSIQEGQDIIVATPGVSCRAQIEDGTGIKTFHPLQLVDQLYRE